MLITVDATVLLGVADSVESRLRTNSQFNVDSCVHSMSASAATATSSSNSSLAAPSTPIRVGVAGCTGVVGQRFIALLVDHPWFDLAALAASDRSAGKSYKEAAAWKLTSDMPTAAGEMIVRSTTVDAFRDAKVTVVFSALDASIAGDFEEALAKAGVKVFSNARNHRYDSRVPILIPHGQPIAS
jgi:hypothetical protein